MSGMHSFGDGLVLLAGVANRFRLLAERARCGGASSR